MQGAHMLTVKEEHVCSINMEPTCSSLTQQKDLPGFRCADQTSGIVSRLNYGLLKILSSLYFYRCGAQKKPICCLSCRLKSAQCDGLRCKVPAHTAASVIREPSVSHHSWPAYCGITWSINHEVINGAVFLLYSGSFYATETSNSVGENWIQVDSAK